MEFYKSRYFDRKKPERSFKKDEKPTLSFRNSQSRKPSRHFRDSDNYSSNNNSPRRDESATVTCSECGTKCQVPFIPRNNKPVYCNDCFRQNNSHDSEIPWDSQSRKPSRHFRDSSNNNNSPRRDESATVTCSECGTKCQVPFIPRNNKPVYCNDCFRQNNSHDSEIPWDSQSHKPSRNTRNDKNLRSSYKRVPSKDTFKSKKLDDKFLRKQEKFFSNGSDKFYRTIKEKLFEILGGKICSNCGFSDERALGISTIHGDTFNGGGNGRGTTASSWGKYISAPQLAREELSVLCLNCNQIREPAPKPKYQPKSKKSRYFS